MMTLPITVKMAVEDDAAPIARVLVETRLHTYSNAALDITVDDLQARFGEMDGTVALVTTWLRSTDARRVWVAKDGPRTIAVCVAYLDDNGGHIGAVYVLPEYQGRGIGKALMQDALAWLGDVEDITLWTAAYNPDPIAFYKGLGFIESGVSWQFPLSNAKTMPLLQMIKPRAGSNTPAPPL